MSSHRLFALALATGVSVLAMQGFAYAQDVRVPGVCLTDQRGDDPRCQCFDDEGDFQPGKRLGADGFCAIAQDREEESIPGAANFDAAVAPDIELEEPDEPDVDNQPPPTVVEEEEIVEEEEEEIIETQRGDNGWGNGAEGINNGSDDGSEDVADSKFSEGEEGVDNSNHTER